jgi:DNA polymerase-3 subunit epsilon
MSEPTSQELIDNLSFCEIDLETTGGNHSKDKIIEIGMVRVKNRKIVGEMSYLVNPEMPIPEFIQNLTNISQKDVKDAKVIEDIMEEVLEFIGDDIIVAHNTSFDVPF